MTLIKKISTIAGTAFTTATAGAFFSYSNTPVLALAKEEKKEPEVKPVQKVRKHDYDSDFFSWPSCFNGGSGSSCTTTRSYPMESF